MNAARQARLVLFAVAAATIVAAALAFGFAAPDSRPEAGAEAKREVLPLSPGAVLRPRAERRELRAAARRFLAAFFRYEVGDLAPKVKGALGETATRRFAAQLLAAPPRAPAAGRFPPRARLGRIALSFVSLTPPRAVVSGAALRGGRPEQFSFLFERRGSAWLASGPGQ